MSVACGSEFVEPRTQICPGATACCVVALLLLRGSLTHHFNDTGPFCSPSIDV